MFRPTAILPASRARRQLLRACSFEGLSTYLLFVSILASACMMPAQSDTFWQLRAGAEIVASGRVLLTDSFTHTVHGADWPNHEWATETLFYLLHRAGGFPLLTFVLAAAVTLAWWEVWQMMKGGTFARLVITAALVGSSARLWSLRPQVLSLLFLVVVVRLITAGRDRWLPVVFAVWANFHGGVLLGFAALTGALIGRALCDVRSVRRAPALLAGCAAASCLTPLGPSLWTGVSAMVERIRLIQIQEWQPPAVSDPWNAPLWIVLVLLPWLAWKNRARLTLEDGTIAGACLALLLLSLRTTRNIMPALMLSAPALSRLAPPGALALRTHVRRETVTVNARLGILATLVASALVAAAWMREPARLNWRPLPTGAAAAIEGCPGPLYNRYDEGGYLVWFTPGQPVFADGRQDPFPPSLLLAQIEAERTGAYTALFERYRINCAALPRTSKVAQSLRRDGWQTTFDHAEWTVLVRPGSGARSAD